MTRVRPRDGPDPEALKRWMSEPLEPLLGRRSELRCLGFRSRDREVGFADLADRLRRELAERLKSIV
ncbi:MAG: hypothetical protein LBQ79_00420 [Deltaproteobacteria bacterium]|nr:hypothetical protein [Deltaproteobacteria bacterium]